MNWRKPIYFSYATMRGYRFPAWLRRYAREYEQANHAEITTRALIRLLAHCRAAVPYYAPLLARAGGTGVADPRDCLRRLPVLTKQIVRENFDRLQSADLSQRKWSYNTS